MDKDNRISRAAEEARVFVLLNPVSIDLSGALKPTVTPDQIDLPFQTCFFEFRQDPKNILVMNQQMISTTQLEEVIPYKRVPLGILMRKNTDGSLNETLIYSRMNNKRNPLQYATFFCGKSETVMLEAYYACKLYLDAFSGKKLAGLAKEKMPIKLSKRASRINDIVYIRQSKKVEPSGNTSEINWSHKFEVRGHWRKISSNSIGRDSLGRSIFVGKTWVKNHIKGDGELIKKTRITRGEDATNKTH